MKNMMSKKIYGKQYSDLPLASEIIVDLKLQIFRYKILTLSLSAALVIALLTACALMR